MKRLAHILVWTFLAAGCSAPAQAPDDGGDDAAGADVAVHDAGSDPAPVDDAGPQLDVSDSGIDATPDGACRTLDETSCYVRDDCAWDGSSCVGADQTSPSVALLTTRTPGVLTSRGHSRLSDGELPAGLTGVQTGTKFRGAITVEDTDRTWSFPVDAEIDALGGTMTADVFVPSCFASGANCDQTIRGFRLTGHFDGTQWLFPSPRRVAAAPDALETLFVNLRFQPNDGIKPSVVPDRSPTFAGPLTSIFDGNPLPTEATCELTFDDADLTAALPVELDCGDVTLGTQGPTRIVTDSFAYLDRGELEPALLWFQLETPAGRLTFVALDEVEHLAGLFVRDDGDYWAPNDDPIAPDDVDPADVVGTAVLFSQEAQ